MTSGTLTRYDGPMANNDLHKVSRGDFILPHRVIDKQVADATSEVALRTSEWDAVTVGVRKSGA